MEALKAVLTRRSVRKYTSKKIPATLVRKLIDAGRNAPSAYNDQPWVFITITRQQTKDVIVENKSQRSQFIKDAPLLIACCYDTNKSKATSHNLENTAVAAENILITAHALGLGACYIGGFDPDYPMIEQNINKALKLPSNVHIVCLISTGYPDEKPIKKKMRPLNEVWKRETYTH